MGLFRRDDGPPDAWGRRLVEATFVGEALERALTVIDGLATVVGSEIADRLANELRVGSWRPSRSAIGALRREKLAALPAAPAIAAWLSSSHRSIPDDAGAYGVREAFHALAELRTIARANLHSDAALTPALRTLVSFLDIDVAALARVVVESGSRRASRGAIAYIASTGGDPEPNLAALRTYLDRYPSGSGDDDFEYARSEALRALQELAAQATRSAAAHAPTSASSAPPSRSPPDLTPDVDGRPSSDEAAPGNPPSTVGAPTATPAPELAALDGRDRAEAARSFVDEEVVPRLRDALNTGSVRSRTAALQAVPRLGPAALHLLPDLWALANDPRFRDEAWGALADQALQLVVALSGPDAAAGGDARVVALLLERLAEDADPAVRAAALDALAQTAPYDAAVQRAAEACLEDVSPEVRVAAIRALARRRG